ncbi:MAG TPA: D-alanyl-D-alanine carboxypeptidase family protein, partial [Hyphomicrobiales bacterium]|nr:D-alanyl-D-alanine carboxypeptidase family protein [Hyphomicrobiales bacterium]
MGARKSAHILGVILTLMILCAAFPSSSEAKKKRHVYSPPQAAMVVDGYSGEILYSSNADEPRYPASVTKVMTLYLLFEQIRDGHMTFKTPLKVSAKAASRPPSKLGLKPSSTISVHDAVYALVTKSANDVAAVVAENIAGSETAFARMMTQKARAIGMTKTTYRNASGLPNSKQVTTARDLITLGRRMRTDFPKLSKVFSTRYFTYGKRKFRNHNRLLFSYSGMEGLKTGFTRASGFNLLASCRREDKYLIAVVLGGRSGKARNARMQTLLDRSWVKAVALKTYKKSNPIAIAGVVHDDDNLPERNPAFHDVDLGPEIEISEEEIAEIKLAMAEQDNAEPVVEQEEAAPVRATALPVKVIISNPEP